ncbi:aldose epimerase family protein [Solirubrobacter deserti]|uniref:Galactose mutarotase n=1 Tax=Solirubrobacter deserti TaxID=2282478 RepID=A0ABT4RT02_9ACTN|nr:aldose epimerase family protein [Solirubrobacter deserti]MDA0141716.1 galactose mutarotase [Solirubrobacter deserti]
MPATKAAERVELTNQLGMSVSVLTYGGILQTVRLPDGFNVALGHDDVADYEHAVPRYMGALIGRYANRIAGARFTLDGVEHELTANDGPNCLHGGDEFDRALWAAEPVRDGVRLTHVSPDGEHGFPGTVTAHVTYTLAPRRNQLKLDFEATTDAPTVVSLTTHSYWRLGDGVPVLQILADRYTPVDAQLIPTGEIAWVAGTEMDFRVARRLEREYDHNWVLNAQGLAAVLRDPASGRVLRLSTTEPGLQVYTHTGVALEPQRFPDSPNQPHFPTAVLRPGQTWRATTTYDFEVRR